MNPLILSSSTITGKTVYNLDRENIGHIKDLMIDPNQAEVVYAVLEFGGLMGIGSKYFAIPIEALQFTDDDENMTLDVNKEMLENAPSFDKDDWPMTADAEFVNTVYSHYGYQNRHKTMI